MTGKKLCVGLAVAVFALLVSVFSMVPPVSAGKGSDMDHLEMMPTPDTPAGFEGAMGTIKFNTTGATLKFTLQASGLVPGEDYAVAFCSEIIGAGTADKNGTLRTWGSANGWWQLDSTPDEPFELRRFDGFVPGGRVFDLELILQSPASWYDWTL